MSAAKRPPLPLILMANDLLDGDVVFRTAGGWSLHHHDALVARDAAAADRLEAAGRSAMANNEVVDACLVDVTLTPECIPVPRHYREKIRTRGPSFRTDLGKQAETPKD